MPERRSEPTNSTNDFCCLRLGTHVISSEPANETRRSLQQNDERRLGAEWVPYSMALLDKHGRISAVNAAWRRFGRENAADPATSLGVGLNYLEACRNSNDPIALTVCDGLRDLFELRREDFTLIYPCHSPTQARWCRIVAQRQNDENGEPAVVV